MPGKTKKIDTCVLRFALAVILLMHSLPSLVTLDVLNFGQDFLAPKGFGVLGIPLAILVKLIQLVSVPVLLFNIYLRLFSILNICILVGGIIMVHFNEGWYVVGGGRNGVEFNFLLTALFLSFLLPLNLFQKLKSHFLRSEEE